MNMWRKWIQPMVSLLLKLVWDFSLEGKYFDHTTSITITEEWYKSDTKSHQKEVQQTGIKSQCVWCDLAHGCRRSDVNLRAHHSSVGQERGRECFSKLWNHIFKKIPSSQEKWIGSIRNQVSNLSAIWSSEQTAWTWVFQVLDFQSWFLKFTQQNKEHLATKPWQKGWHYKGSKEQVLPLFWNRTFLVFSEIPDLAVREMLCWGHHAHSSITLHYP